jgi:hypothetical protein
MAFISQTANPWDVPSKQAVAVMQKIWDATSHKPYEITSSGVIYQKVCDCLSSRTILKSILDYSTRCRLMARCYWVNWHLSRLGLL